jgi:nitrous oxide reductase accessory protein NosL
MGKDLVPLADRAAAERFVTDHGGRIWAFGEIGLAQIERAER